jgi:hypothetical protein
MPFGLWKSKVECYREENDRRHAEWREQMGRRDAEWRQERADAQTERARADKRHDELIARLDKNQQERTAAFKIVVVELRGIRRELNDLIDAVNANTEAILKLIDRFDQGEGRPPGSGRMGPRSA